MSSALHTRAAILAKVLVVWRIKSSSAEHLLPKVSASVLNDERALLEFKEKIKNEIKKGTAKENLFTEEERVLITSFIKKIKKELSLTD